MKSSIKKSFKQTTIIEGVTSYLIFSIPVILSILIFFYGVIIHKLNFFTSLSLITLFLIYPIINTYKRKILVTNNKIYFYFLGKKSLSLHYLNDFYIINYKQNILGKIFNYGTLILIDQNNHIYQFSYLNDIFNVYEKIILTYENYIISKNPSYIKKYLLQKENSILDKLNEMEIKNDQ